VLRLAGAGDEKVMDCKGARRLIPSRLIGCLKACLNYKMRFGRVSPLQVSKSTHLRGQYQISKIKTGYNFFFNDK